MTDTRLTFVAAYFDKKEILYVSSLPKVDVKILDALEVRARLHNTKLNIIAFDLPLLHPRFNQAAKRMKEFVADLVDSVPEEGLNAMLKKGQDLLG